MAEMGGLFTQLQRELDLLRYHPRTFEHSGLPDYFGWTFFNILINQSLVGLYVIQNERFLYATPKLARIFGYSQHEILSLPSVLELVVEEDRPVVANNLWQRQAGSFMP